MSRLSGISAELIAPLKSGHARIMGGRPDEGPGRFKAEWNLVGATSFVTPELVEEAFAKGNSRALVRVIDMPAAIRLVLSTPEVVVDVP